MADEVADCPDVIPHLLQECQSAAYQPREPLPECLIEPLDKAAACVSFLGADNLIAKRGRRAPVQGGPCPPYWLRAYLLTVTVAMSSVRVFLIMPAISTSFVRFSSAVSC